MRIYAHTAWMRRHHMTDEVYPGNALDVSDGFAFRSIKRSYRRLRKSGASSIAAREVIWEMLWLGQLHSSGITFVSFKTLRRQDVPA